MLDYGELVGLIADTLPAVNPWWYRELHHSASQAGERRGRGPLAGLDDDGAAHAQQARTPRGDERSPAGLQAYATMAARGGLRGEAFTPLRHAGSSCPL